MITIYSILNTNNKKRYIGISSDFKNRKRIHVWAMKNNKHRNLKLQRSVNRHGIESFDFEVLEELENDDRMNALMKENEYINKFNSYNNGYNQSEGFEFSFLYKESLETKLKRRRLMSGNTYWLGKKHTEETKEKIGNVHRGKTVSDETKKKLSNSRKGKFIGEDNSFYGKNHSQKTRETIRRKQVEFRGTKVKCVETGKVFDSISECSREMNCDRRNIRKVCDGVCKSTKGYSFELCN